MFNARTRSAISGPTAGRCSCRCRPLKPHWSSTLSYLKVALGVVRVLEIAPPPSPIFYLEGRSNTRFKPRPTKGQRPSATLLAKHALHISIIYRLACPISLSSSPSSSPRTTTAAWLVRRRWIGRHRRRANCRLGNTRRSQTQGNAKIR